MADDIWAAQPGDIYQAPHGTAFIVQATHDGKWVSMKELVPQGEQQFADGGCAHCTGRMSGGAAGLMWDGFKRISAAQPTHSTPERADDGNGLKPEPAEQISKGE